MFPRERRLRTSTDIVATLRKGRRQIVAPLSVSHLLTGNILRATVIIDNKVAKRATKRNLFKRRVRAIVREASIQNGDMVIRALPGASTMSFAELKQKLNQCLKRLS